MRIWPLSASWPITVGDGAESLKGSHTTEDGRIFLKNLRDTSINKDLSNEPNFGLTHLAGPLSLTNAGTIHILLKDTGC